MDKFDVPNRIVNGVVTLDGTNNSVVIVDGTTQTAAHTAGYKGISPRVKSGIHEPGKITYLICLLEPCYSRFRELISWQQYMMLTPPTRNPQMWR